MRVLRKRNSKPEVAVNAVPCSSEDAANPAPVPQVVANTELNMVPGSSGEKEEAKPEVLEVVMADNSADKVVPRSVNEVLNIPELREAIISSAIYQRVDNKAVLCHNTITALRLISKDWLMSVSEVIRKDKEILFHLTLDKENSLNGTLYVAKQNGKLLENFVKFMSADWNQECCPRARVKIMPEFFRNENYFSWSSFLAECGNLLVKLDISVPKNSSMPVAFPSFSLPVLKELTVRLKKDNLRLKRRERMKGGSVNITHLVSSMLNGSGSLSKFTVDQDSQNGRIPKNFESVPIPNTVSTLVLNCTLSGAQLEHLAGKGLPNLSVLKLLFPDTPFPEGLLFNVLKSHKTTLKSLHFQGSLVFNNASLDHKIRFPNLQKLEDLSIVGMNIDLEPGVTSLHSSLPSLKYMTLFQKQANFRLWTQSSRFTKVEYLYLQRAMPLTTARSQLLHSAFPNVTWLMLNIVDQNPHGLKHLFMHMTQLERLGFYVHRTSPSVNLNYWDALLTGTSRAIMAGLRATPSLWYRTGFKDVPSISNLSELKYLAMLTINNAQEQQPMISDLAFIHALNKMPNLIHLKLSGGFKPSSVMQSWWESAKPGVLKIAAQD